ncbi:hypothetical protein [uncultured Clostridium sp.]|nr:hypothetical protein [uncultured Clostridium sp.]
MNYEDVIEKGTHGELLAQKGFYADHFITVNLTMIKKLLKKYT